MASVFRFRPIILTAVTAILAVIPLMFSNFWGRCCIYIGRAFYEDGAYADVNKGLGICDGVTALSGLFLMPHFESHYAKAAHQICGVLFIVFSSFHIKVNFKPLRGNFAAKSIAAASVVFLISIAIMLVTDRFAG